MARRAGDEWYVGALTGWDARTVEIDLGFIPEGDYSVEIFRDGINADRVAADYRHETIDLTDDRKITVNMAPGGGFAARIFKKRSVEKYDVYLLIGQSNMAGRGYMLDEDMEIFDENVFILNDVGEVVPATNPLNQYSSVRKGMSIQRIGPGYGFAKKISRETGRKILLVVNAKGGTTLSQWAKGDGGDGLFEEAVRRTKEAMLYGSLKAILWHQGCGDSRNTDVYMEKLALFVENLRTDLDADVPFIAGELGQWRSNVAAFNEMIHTISEYIPQSGWISSEGGTPLASPDSNGEPNLKDAHFDRESQIIIGERYADKVLEMCFNRTLNKNK